MPSKHIYLTRGTETALKALAVRWGLSDSATIARALQMALEGQSAS